MSKNANKPQSVVTTSLDPSTIASMTVEERLAFIESVSATLPVTAQLQAAGTINTAAKSKVESDVARIDAEIAKLREQIAPLNQQIADLLAEKSALGIKAKAEGTRTRTTKECACGQRSHHVTMKDGSAGTTCEAYEQEMRAKAADTRINQEARAQYLARAEKVVENRNSRAA